MISQSDNMIFFNNIHYDIHFIHGTLKNYNEFPEELLPHNIQLMAIDDISADLIEKMMHNLPFYLSHIEYKSRTIQKRNLKFLLVALEEFGYTPINDSVSKHEDDTINLWNVVDGNTPDNLRTYLNLLRTALRFINLHTPMKPISFKVTTNNTSIVQLQLKSEISCAGFEFINIPNVDYLFWQLIHDKNIDLQTSLKIKMILLNLQRLTAWGKNKVIPIKADEHSLIIELHLAQADTFHTIYNQEPTLAEVASNHMMNYIAKCFYPTYLELSHQLEARFKASQVTYRQYLSQENEPEDEISSFLDNTLNTLEEVREEYSVLMSQVD